jgi:hypothetical protein
MSALKHTAGPWEVETHLKSATLSADNRIIVAGGLKVASVCPREGDANARLIAAAPDYAAAAAPLVHLVEFFGGDDSDEISVTAGELRALAAAHAKAKGADQ